MNGALAPLLPGGQRFGIQDLTLDQFVEPLTSQSDGLHDADANL